MTETAQTEAMVVANRSEIPSGDSYIWFNPGHTRQLIEAGLIGQESIYYVSGEKRPIASVAVDIFLNNPVLRENQNIDHPSFFTKGLDSSSPSDRQISPAQDFLFGIIGEELGQKGPLENLQEILEQIESGEMPIIPGKGMRLATRVSGYQNDIPAEHNSAIAVRNLLQKMNGPETKYRQGVKTATQVILSGDLDYKTKMAEELVTEIKRKLGL